VCNNFQGWSHTVNTHEGGCLRPETSCRGLPLRRAKFAPWSIAEKKEGEKQDNGTLRSEPRDVPSTVLLWQRSDGKAVALRVAGPNQPGAPEQWWMAARATKLSTGV